MNSRRATLICLVLTCIATPAFASDVQIDVQQSVPQKLLTALGTVGVSGGSSTSVAIPYPGFCKVWDWIYVPCIKWTSCTAQYSWSASVSNLNVQIIPSGIPFTGNGAAQASASICGIGPSLSYSPDINGLMSATWQVGPQELWFSMQTLNIEIYVKILGFKIHLAWVNVGGLVPNPLYKQKLAFAQQFTLPAPISKQITVTLQNPTVTLFPGFLRFTGDLKFTSP
jgi:hypothetical protein